MTAVGIQLSIDPFKRYNASSKVLVTLGIAAATLGMAAVASGIGMKDQQVVVVVGLLMVAPVGVLSYRFGNTFLLSLGLIGFFHWVGALTQMLGASTYEISVQDPILMSLAAMGTVGVGVYHEKELRNRTGRFFEAYEALGLIYLNLSLLILSIEGDPRLGSKSFWIGVLTIMTVAQIVAGARLHNPLITGFGVTAFAVNAYTRYYETFWNRLHQGIFFLLGGMSLLTAGLICEIVLRRWQRRTI